MKSLSNFTNILSNVSQIHLFPVKLNRILAKYEIIFFKFHHISLCKSNAIKFYHANKIFKKICLIKQQLTYSVDSRSKIEIVTSFMDGTKGHECNRQDQCPCQSDALLSNHVVYRFSAKQKNILREEHKRELIYVHSSIK